MSLLRCIRRSLGAGLSIAGIAVAVPALAILGNAGPASASTTQLSMFEVPGILDGQDPGPTLQILRSLGVEMLRVPLLWQFIAPDASSRTRPSFNAADPNSYPAGTWAALDQLVNEAKNDGIQLDFEPTGGAPLWATQTGGPPCGPTGGDGPYFCYDNSFEPSASEYGQFVQALATRYPSVHFWELWDEANWGPALAPQYSNSSVPVSAGIYRGLLNAGWNALQATGHGGDTILDTSLSQDASANVGETGTSAPLIFIRTLWCADSSYGHLTGDAATEAGCPTTPAGYQQFKADNPALFQASGVGIHPYPYGQPPTLTDFPSPDGAEFAEIPQLVTALDKLQQLYGSAKQMSVDNTEYGYRTRPNDTQAYFTDPANAAAYINEAEYLSWKNPRIGTYDQYELTDSGWFPTGLFFAPQTTACSGTGLFQCPKPSFDSYRFPVWLPVNSTPRGQAIEVWGNARPAYFARLDTGQPQSVQIQWAGGSSGQFQTVKTVQASSLGFLDTQVNFPGSGQVRLAWEYPPGDSSLSDPLDPSAWIYSRVTNITVYQHTASGHLSGLRKGHPKLGITVGQGTDAPAIESVTVSPPRGVKFKCIPARKKKLKNKACGALTARGGKVKNVTVSGGKLTLNLVKPGSRISITGVPPFVHVTSGLARTLKHRKTKTVTFTLVIVDANGASSTIPLKLTAKS